MRHLLETSHTTEKCWFNSKGQEKGFSSRWGRHILGCLSRNLKWEETASSLSHPRRNTNSRKVLVRPGNTDFSWSRPSKSCRAASKERWATLAEQRKVSQLEAMLANPKERIRNLVIHFGTEGQTRLAWPQCWHQDHQGVHDEGSFWSQKEVRDSRTSIAWIHFETTWQWSEKLQQSQCQELRKKWKLLNEPHANFDGNKISAIQVVETIRVWPRLTAGVLL